MRNAFTEKIKKLYVTNKVVRCHTNLRLTFYVITADIKNSCCTIK